MVFLDTHRVTYFVYIVTGNRHRNTYTHTQAVSLTHKYI